MKVKDLLRNCRANRFIFAGSTQTKIDEFKELYAKVKPCSNKIVSDTSADVFFDLLSSLKLNVDLSDKIRLLKLIISIIEDEEEHIETFVVSRITRSELKELGLDTSKISNASMEEFCKHLDMFLKEKLTTNNLSFLTNKLNINNLKTK